MASQSLKLNLPKLDEPVLSVFGITMKRTKNLKNQNLPKNIIRPPVVVLLGHVDHGKTTLLDAIANSQFTKREFGEITQSIRAAEVETKFGKITFIDTPGHSYFTNLRGQGVKFADIALLVVSSVEGVLEQTVESIKLIKQAKIPVICVISKIDLPNSNTHAVISQLATQEILTERLGGKVPVVEVCAVEKKGIDDLIETISILAELNPPAVSASSLFEGVVLESYLDKKIGPTSLILVQQGTLKPGSNIFANSTACRVRAIFDTKDSLLSEAIPAQPVKILGFEKVIHPGTKIHQLTARQTADNLLATKGPIGILERELAKKQLGVIIKADNTGSQEAILANLPKDIKVIDSGTGSVSGSDVEKAVAAGVKIFGFNVGLTVDAKKLLNFNGNQNIFYSSRLIYELVSEIKKAQQIFQSKNEAVLGLAKILKTFNIKEVKIAGCKVVDGFLEVGGKVKIVRGDKVIGEATIGSLKQLTTNLTKVSKNSECGVGFTNPVDFQVGDVLQFIS